MSKHNPKGVPGPTGKPMSGRVIYDYQIGSLEGRMLTFIESLGFNESREEAVKDIIKSILRYALYLETTSVEGEFLNEAIRKNQESGFGQAGGIDVGPSVI